MTATPTVTIVDDDQQVLELLQVMLASHFENVRAFASAAEFLNQHDPQAVGCVILDMNMPGLTGLQVQEQLVATGSNLSVVVLSGSVDIPMAVKAMQQGALTLLEKPYNKQQLLDAVQQGIDRSVAESSKRQASDSVRVRLAQLDGEELAVLRRMLDGKSNKQIVADLLLSPRTVDRRRQSILEKMAVETVVELAQQLAPLNGDPLLATD